MTKRFLSGTRQDGRGTKMRMSRLSAVMILCSLVASVALSNEKVSTEGLIALPATMQTDCYNAQGEKISCKGTGQDGESRKGVPHPQNRFAVEGDCVLDRLTGLIWAKDANLPGGTRTWQGALDYVAELNAKGGLCGHTDWRLPNVTELVSLLNKKEPSSSGWLNTQGFVNVQGYNYWTSTTRAGHESHAWRIQMRGGSMYIGAKVVNGFVWPVRSGDSRRRARKAPKP